MNGNLRQKIPKASKKGMSLVELVVGVTIIAIVLASAAGAIVTGYKTTIDNAERNKVAAISSSMNEVVMKAVKNCGFNNRHEASKHFLKDDIFPANDVGDPKDVPAVADANLAVEPVHQAALSVFSGAYLSSILTESDSYIYRDASVRVLYASNAQDLLNKSFPDSGYEVQYCIVLDTTRNIQATKTVPINGIEIRTVVYTSTGVAEETVSFVPYKKQVKVK